MVVVPSHTRDRIRNTRQNEDQRLLVIVGPCSVHDVNAAYEYGKKLVALRKKLEDDLEIVMRVYFEKPRTKIGWKGLVNAPHLGVWLVNCCWIWIWLSLGCLLPLNCSIPSFPNTSPM